MRPMNSSLLLPTLHIWVTLLDLKNHISPEKKAKRLFCIKIFEVRMKLDKMRKERRSGKVEHVSVWRYMYDAGLEKNIKFE